MIDETGSIQIILDWLEDKIPPSFTQCDTLRGHIPNLVTHFVSSSLSKKFSGSPEDLNPSIGIYEPALQNLVSCYDLGYDQEEVIKSLDINALTYTTLLIAKSLGVSSLELGKDLKRIEKSCRKALDAFEEIANFKNPLFEAAFILEDTREYIKKFREDSNYIIENPPETMVERAFIFRVHKIQSELLFFTDISDHFKNSYLGEWLQYKAKGPKNNNALDLWLHSLAEGWTTVLNRSFSKKNCQFSGREVFLNFAVDCMEPLHPEIEAETIRNAFDKLRKKGTLDYLEQK